MKQLTWIICLMISAWPGQAQTTGQVDYPRLGVSFSVPDGWLGQEANGLFVMASQTVAGLIMILPHDRSYTKEELKTLASQGYNEANGTQLIMESEPKLISNGVAGSYQGYLEGQPAKAYAVGLVNPHGNGLTILAATTLAQYGKQYETYAMQVARSVNFYPAETEAFLNRWEQLLSGVKLTYMDSNYSTSPGMNTASYSSETRIDLCQQGHFKFYSSSNVSVSSGQAGGYGYSNDGGHGQWKLNVSPAGEAQLVLEFYNGKVNTYILSYTNEKLYLNGSRYFRTTSGEYAPSCP